MNTPKLAIAMNYIDDGLISGAEDYQPTRRRKLPVLWKYIAAAAACMVLVLGISFMLPRNEVPPIRETPSPGEAPAHFYFEGNLYSYSGDLVYALPEGFRFVHEVKNVGSTFTGGDFEGNVDGSVFMSESDRTVAYFRWKRWNEAIDGPEPYLVLHLIEQE